MSDLAITQSHRAYTDVPQTALLKGKQPAIVVDLEDQIRMKIVRSLATWISAKLDTRRLANISSNDRRFARLLFKSANLSSVVIDPKIEDALNEDGQNDGIEQCPACKSSIVADDGDQAKCAKGHEWGKSSFYSFNLRPAYPDVGTARCCITRQLITTASHRICSICPAVSLLPDQHKGLPIPVDRSGEALDWQRFVRPTERESDEPQDDGMNGPSEQTGELDLVQIALQAGLVCPMCAGRWIRVA